MMEYPPFGLDCLIEANSNPNVEPTRETGNHFKFFTID